jgi:transcriptional regulator with XRE-family HTH domain
MPDSNPVSLVEQLAARTKSFLNANNLTQKELARFLRIDKANFSKFLNGTAGLNAETTLQLVRLMSLNKRDLALKFGEPDRTRARLMYLQESGTPLHFDANEGWYPGTDGAGVDPNGSTSIVETNKNPARVAPTDDDLEFLAGLATLYQSIIDKINARQAVKGKVNKSGETESPRKIGGNADSSKPGPRGDLFSRGLVDPKEYLVWLKAERAKTEAQIELRQQIEREQKLTLNAKSELLRMSN